MSRMPAQPSANCRSSPLAEFFVCEITKMALGDCMEMTMNDLNRPEFTTDQLIAEILANLRNDDQRDAEALDILSDSISAGPF